MLQEIGGFNQASHGKLLWKSDYLYEAIIHLSKEFISSSMEIVCSFICFWILQLAAATKCDGRRLVCVCVRLSVCSRVVKAWIQLALPQSNLTHQLRHIFLLCLVHFPYAAYDLWLKLAPGICPRDSSRRCIQYPWRALSWKYGASGERSGWRALSMMLGSIDCLNVLYVFLICCCDSSKLKWQTQS